jgi:ribonuclease HI
VVVALAPLVGQLTYDVDGWMMGRNPAPGGGFTIVDQDNRLVYRSTFRKAGWTNNDAELWAIAAAAHLAAVNDTIRSDSEVMTKWWIPRGVCKSRPDLNILCKMAHDEIRDKRLSLVWVPREQNLAGIYNDNHKTWLCPVD